MRPESANDMNSQRNSGLIHASSGRVALVMLSCVGALLAGCAEPTPRTFSVFMEDRIARDGVLARCNQDREATERDIECANARRAASVMALREERAKRVELERESERKLAELREQIARRDRAKRNAMAAALAAAEAAYEAQWADADALELNFAQEAQDGFPSSAPLDGVVIGPSSFDDKPVASDRWLDSPQADTN